jgi:hypothetical protein
MHKSATKCNETICKWCKNKHGASKIIDTLETYQLSGCPIFALPPSPPALHRHRSPGTSAAARARTLAHRRCAHTLAPPSAPRPPAPPRPCARPRLRRLSCSPGAHAADVDARARPRPRHSPIDARARRRSAVPCR